MKRRYLVFLSLLTAVLLSGCSKKQPYKRETDIFNYYMQQMGVEKELNHTYYLLPAMSCTGCKVMFSNYFVVHGVPGQTTIFISNAIIETIGALEDIITQKEVKRYPVDVQREQELLSNIYVDSMRVMDELNWNYANLIRIDLQEGAIVSVRDYSAQQIDEDFSLERHSD